MQENTPGLWDAVWSDDISAEQDRFALALERASVRWRRIRERVAHRGDLADSRVIEIGAGAGTASALFAEQGASVTVLDYSAKALERARAFYANNGLSAEFVEANALDLPDTMRGAYDVSISLGLAEHFTGSARVGIVRAHLDLLSPGGDAFVSVPNRLNVPYRLYKAIAERVGRWKVGEEYPFTPGELVRVGREAGGVDVEVFGESALGSLYFVDPARILRRLRGVPDRADTTRIRPQSATPFDDRYAYAIVLHARRPD